MVTFEELGYLDPDLYKVHIMLIFYHVKSKPSYSLFTSFTATFYLMIINDVNIFLNILQDDTFLYKASIKRFNTRYEWWYATCLTCAKQMYNEWSIDLSKTSKSNPNSLVIIQILYKVFLVLKDETNEINALIIGKSGEKVFGAPCKDLVFNQRSADQKQLLSEFLRLIGQRKKIHL
ncbi:hypothetical protein DVH24_034894 [Malus domestica]|uniref:Replication factor A C-terminal domain-containing protein n=1 Tax=Malus domestica TaxID=3750 RepID=A0A498IJN8_MALDO|nr:hypothetical protein DVH24_034894 [Malus domestica]